MTTEAKITMPHVKRTRSVITIPINQVPKADRYGHIKAFVKSLPVGRAVILPKVLDRTFQQHLYRVAKYHGVHIKTRYADGVLYVWRLD